jgi:hypothetical protein
MKKQNYITPSICTERVFDKIQQKFMIFKENPKQTRDRMGISYGPSKN